MQEINAQFLALPRAKERGPASASTSNPEFLIRLDFGHEVRDPADAKQGDAALLDLFYFDLLARGVWFAKRGMMALSIALDEADADRLVAAVEEFAESRRPLFA